MIYQLASLQQFLVAELSPHCATLQKKRFGDVTLEDLAVHPGSFGGVYAFYGQNNECLYVGKTSSRGLPERIGAHLDPREHAYMNHFLKKLIRANYAENLHAALEYALSCRLCLFTFSTEERASRQNCQNAEEFFRKVLAPLLNPLPSGLDGNMLVRVHLPCC